ncbi:MAG: hypothetical protein KQJ78_23010 [Deltaproteobacteria bacterium]|nr:hypothetical protein [Deltaproteobacteria bacterium]
METKRVAFLIEKSDDCWEGVRSTLGLLVENFWAAAFIIDCPVELPASKSEEEFQENLEMLVEDLEGEVYSNVQANVDRFEYLEYMSLEDMAAKIKEYELVVPFGG